MKTNLIIAACRCACMITIYGIMLPVHADDIRPTIKLKLAPEGEEGQLEIHVPKTQLLQFLEREIPAATDLPEQKLGDQLIYHDVQLNKVRAASLKPTTIRLADGKLQLAGEPLVSGELNALYEHIVITTEVRKIGRIGGRDIKTSVPVKRSDWRPKGPTPFTIKVELAGTAMFSLTEGDSVDKQRLRITSKVDIVRITEVKLDTNDAALKLLANIVGVVGKALPNEGFNKPIQTALTRELDVELFQNLSVEDRSQLQSVKLKDVLFETQPDEVRITAKVLRKAVAKRP